MNIKKRDKAVDISLAITFLCFFLILYGALPLVGIPTLGQALWSSSFAQSFANESIFDIYAKNIGAPSPAAMSFGLSGAWIQSLFIRVGFAPADAYSLMHVFWITIAYLCAYKISLTFCMNRRLAIIAGATWVALPIGWGHTGFSMLALGILLFPLYFLSTINLHQKINNPLKKNILPIGFHVLCCVVSAFMDGYTFIMFAVGSFSLTLANFLLSGTNKLLFLTRIMPIHFISFFAGYLLYSLYISFDSKSNFNGYYSFTGLNLFDLIVPQQGVTWIFEALNLGVPSTGDTRLTAFAAPILLLAIYFLCKLRCEIDSFSKSVILVSIVALFLSLGPHLQFPRFSQLDLSNLSESLTKFNIADFYLIPTGSEYIYKYLPGFNNMRVTFRWIALAIFMLWLFVVINLRHMSLSLSNKKITFILLASVVITTPNLSTWIKYSFTQREMFSEVELKLAQPLSKLIGHQEAVAFVPWTNDMIVPYLAARGKYKTLNIAGDKNIQSAQSSWPANFVSFGNLLSKQISPNDVQIIYSILAAGEADAIVIPHISKLWRPNDLPCFVVNDEQSSASQHLFKYKPRGEGFICPKQMLNYDPEVIIALQSDKRISALKTEYFTLVRLRNE